MTRITPQDLHKEILLTNNGYPEEWEDLDDEQRAMFAMMARNLNRIVDGDNVWRVPTRRTLIAQHQRAIDELTNKPVSIGSFADRFMEQSLDQGMMQYHKSAFNYLENDGKIEDTIDALSSEELEDMMRAKGYFICYCEDDQEG